MYIVISINEQHQMYEKSSLHQYNIFTKSLYNLFTNNKSKIILTPKINIIKSGLIQYEISLFNNIRFT